MDLKPLYLIGISLSQVLGIPYTSASQSGARDPPDSPRFLEGAKMWTVRQGAEREQKHASEGFLTTGLRNVGDPVIIRPDIAMGSRTLCTQIASTLHFGPVLKVPPFPPGAGGVPVPV